MQFANKKPWRICSFIIYEGLRVNPNHHQESPPLEICPIVDATEGSGCFISRTRYRGVNVAQNEGHASAVRTGHKRHLCACTPRGGCEALGGVPTTAFPFGKHWTRPDMTQVGGTGAGAPPPVTGTVAANPSCVLQSSQVVLQEPLGTGRR